MAQKNQDAIDRLQKGLIIALFAVVGILVLILAVRMLSGGTELQDLITTQSGPAAEGEGSGNIDELLAQARAAMADSRMVSPSGNNAYEHYLAVLSQQPNNVSAREALNDLYGIAVSSADQAVAAGDFEDAERLATMLAVSNPNSFTVVNLRQRIERARDTALAAEQAAQQRQAQAQASAGEEGEGTAAPPPAPAPSQPVPEPASDLASLTSPSAPPPTPAATTGTSPGGPAVSTTRPATTTAAAAPPIATPAVREARLLSRVDPAYPREAMRGRQQGWVEVEFTIGIDGSVSNAQVVASRPSRVFDRAATRAIQEWRFEPRQENGQPVASRLRQRFDFRLD